MNLTGGVPFDGRRLDEGTAGPTMLDCIERLRRGKFDGVAAWRMDTLMERGWGYTAAVQAAIDGFQGEGVDSLFLRALQLFCGYGVDENHEEAFRMFSEGVKLGDPSGRCHGWLGKCHDYGEGTEENMDKAIQMYRAAVALGDPRAHRLLGVCYEDGEGVPEDIDEARCLNTLSHRQGYVGATYHLGRLYRNNIPQRVALFKEASERGDEYATKELEDMQRDSSSVVPFGCWSPQRHVHRWVSDSMHREMLCLLMARRRPDGLVNTLPKLVIHRICFYIACRPEEYFPPSAEMMMLAKHERRNWRLPQSIALMHEDLNGRIERIERNTEAQLANLQQLMGQQMAAVQQLLSASQYEEGEPVAGKRSKQ